MVKIRGLFSKKHALSQNFEPEVTLIVPCFNEASFIGTKVANSFKLNYPSNKLKFIFISDGSSDETHQILKKYSNILALHQDERKGKANAMNRAMQYVNTSIVVFCDANTLLNENAIHELVKHYQNPKVGAVTGEKRITSKTKNGASVAGEGVYWKYESVLKQLDSDFYSVVGAAGELMSYRTELYTILPDDAILDDLIQSMQIVIKGYRVVYEKNAFATETASSNINEELKRKIRISAGAWQSLPRLGKALNPFYDFKLFFLFMSHKVFRWILAPFLLLVLFVVNIFLANQDFYFFTFLAQILFYLFALQGWYFQNKKIKLKLFFVPYYFFIMNLCMYLGLLKFLRGKQSVNWERAKRA